MTMASNSYIPPGVTVSETIDPSIAPLLATPALVCLVGLAEGLITKTDAVTLSADTAVTLPGVSETDVMTAGSIIKVVDAITPSISEALSGGVYAAGDDGYDFDESAHTIARGASSKIPDGNTVYVTYTYTPADFFNPIRLDNMSDVENRFGSAYDSTGSKINSVLSYGAGIAFENGASDLVLQPLFYNNAGVKQQPDDTQAATASVWADNFANLRDINSINVLVPVVGQSAANVNDATQLQIIQAAQDHAKFMNNQYDYSIIIAGEDSSESSSVAEMETLRTHATTLAGRYGGELAEQTVLLAPSKFSRFLPTGSATQLFIGGQYGACAVAGMIASRPVSQSLTRKVLSGIAAVGERRTKADKNADAAAGLLVIEQKGGAVQVRHGVTINTTGGVAKREISVVRAKHRVVESIRDTIETQIIGQVVADGDAPLVVRSAIIAVLEELRLARDLVDYGDVQARTKSLDPTEIEVRFSYRPAVPINFVSIGFSLDLTTGNVETVSTTNVDTTTF